MAVNEKVSPLQEELYLSIRNGKIDQEGARSLINTICRAAFGRKVYLVETRTLVDEMKADLLFDAFATYSLQELNNRLK